MMDAHDLRQNIKIAEELLERKKDEIRQIQEDLMEMRRLLMKELEE